MKLGLTYTAMLISFFIIDMIWLGFVARGFYQQQIGHWLSDQVNWSAAIIFYLIFLVGLLTFVVMPTAQSPWLHVIGLGILFGVVTYSAYDLTNLATMKDWPLTVTIVDICWGGILSAIVSCVGHLIIKL